MGLEPVLARQPAAVIGDRERQEVELEVGILDPRPAPDEAAGLEMVGRAEALGLHASSAGRPSRRRQRPVEENSVTGSFDATWK